MAHTYRFEAGGAAVFGGIQPQPLPFQGDGTLDLDAVAGAIKPDDFHFARTVLLCLENTQAGKALPLPYLAAARALADRRGLALHLDGARLFNAAAAADCEAADIAGHFDSVSVCLSKGLGAPAGSVLCGSEAFVAAARRWRKALGGGMRQAGILAAAGLYALDHNVVRLADDHRRAQTLASSLVGAGVAVSQHTNMVFVDGIDTGRMVEAMAVAGIAVSGPRWVIHLDIGDEDIERIARAAKPLAR